MEKQLAVRNPRSGKDDYEIEVTTVDRIKELTSAMRKAQVSWHSQGLDYRVSVMEKLKVVIKKYRNDIIEALTIDTGRLNISVAEVDGISGAIDRWAAIALNEAPPETKKSKTLPFIEYRSENQPFAVVGVISPWNFPMTLSLIDVLPALVAGASVIIKPSEVTPRFAAPLRKAIAEVSELNDILHVVDGDGSTGAALIDHVDAICFTGSVATGRIVAEAAARNFIPSFLELGGKDPAIVLDDADVDRATTSLLRASVLNTGHACQSIERIYVHDSIFDEFVAQMIEKANGVTLNYPDLHSGHIGPIIFNKQAAIIEKQIEDAVRKGATIHTGGKIEHHGGGLWCRPTVMTGVSHDMSIMKDETFGPILPIASFSDDEEAIALANDTVYGLSGAVFSCDISRANEVAMQIDAGGISINDGSLTGLMHEAEKNSFKLSGLGASRMGPTGYGRFFRKKAIITNTADVFHVDVFDEKNAKYP